MSAVLSKPMCCCCARLIKFLLWVVRRDLHAFMQFRVCRTFVWKTHDRISWREAFAIVDRHRQSAIMSKRLTHIYCWWSSIKRWSKHICRTFHASFAVLLKNSIFFHIKIMQFFAKNKFKKKIPPRAHRETHNEAQISRKWISIESSYMDWGKEEVVRCQKFAIDCVNVR